MRLFYFRKDIYEKGKKEKIGHLIELAGCLIKAKKYCFGL